MRDRGLELRLAADASALPALTQGLDVFTRREGLSASVAGRLAMVCDELVTNIVTHGAAPPVRATSITVDLRRKGAELNLRIEDDGAPFDPLSLPAPDVEASLEARKVGGLGIHLVRTLASEVRYERVVGRNRLDIRLTLADEAGGEVE